MNAALTMAVGVLPTLLFLTYSLYVAFSSSWQSISELVTAKFGTYLPSLTHTHAGTKGLDPSKH